MNDCQPFISTKEHRKFTEFCNACKDYQYIGLCHGIPGIGKTMSAKEYSKWEIVSEYYESNLKKFINQPELLSSSPGLLECDTVLITASMTHTATRIEKSIHSSACRLDFIKRFLGYDDQWSEKLR